MATKARIEIELANGQKAGQTLKELTQTANRLKREISNLKPGSEAFIKKSQDFRKVTGRLKDVRDEVKGVSKEQKGLNGQFLQFIPFGPQIQRMAGGFNLLKGSVGGTTKGFKALKIAIASTGIGLLVIALGSLVTYLQSTQEGMDKVTAVMRPLSAIFQRLIGLVQDLGGKAFKGLGEAIKNPKQALMDFGDFIKDQFLNRIKSIGVAWKGVQLILSGDIKEGFKELANSQIQLLTGMENGVDRIMNSAKATTEWINEGIAAGTRIDDLQKQIEKTENILIVSRARLNAEYQKSKELAQDQSKSDDERKAAAIAAQNAQNQLLNIEQKFIDLKIAKMKEEHALNDTSRADKKELAQLEAERTTFEAMAARKRASAKSLENTVDREIAAESKKTAEEAAKFKEEMLQKEVDARIAIQDLTIEAMAAGLEKELAQMQLDTERKIEALIGSEAQIAEQKALLLEVSKQEQQAIRDKYNKEQATKRAKADEKEIKDIKTKAAAKKSIQETGLVVFSDSIDSGIALLSKDEDSRKKNAEAIKAFETGRIAIGLQAEIQSIWEYANANAANALFPGAGNIIAGFKTIAALARAGSATSKILSTKMSYGGVLRGPSHAQGGIPVEAEGDEIILTKGVYKDPIGRALASDLNAAYGGIRFMESGGPVNPLSASQAAAASGITGGATQEAAEESLNIAKATLAAIMEFPKVLQVHNNVQDTREGITVINNLEADAGF